MYYESLKRRLEEDITWKGVDIDSALKRTKFNDASRSRLFYTDDDMAARYRRCANRAYKRISEPTKKPDDFNSFLDEMYNIQCYKEFKPIDDFMDCICCPLIYNNKFILFEKLKAMITGKLEEPRRSTIREHKIFNMDLLRSGMRISAHLPGVITSNDVYFILNNIDTLYGHICPNCIYAVMSVVMYEITPLTEYRQILLNDEYSMYYREMDIVDKTTLKNFLETNDTKYLKQLEHTICNNATWYKELKN